MVFHHKPRQVIDRLYVAKNVVDSPYSFILVWDNTVLAESNQIEDLVEFGYSLGAMVTTPTKD